MPGSASYSQIMPTFRVLRSARPLPRKAVSRVKWRVTSKVCCSRNAVSSSWAYFSSYWSSGWFHIFWFRSWSCEEMPSIVSHATFFKAAIFVLPRPHAVLRLTQALGTRLDLTNRDHAKKLTCWKTREEGGWGETYTTNRWWRICEGGGHSVSNESHSSVTQLAMVTQPSERRRPHAIELNSRGADISRSECPTVAISSGLSRTFLKIPSPDVPSDLQDLDS